MISRRDFLLSNGMALGLFLNRSIGNAQESETGPDGRYYECGPGPNGANWCATGIDSKYFIRVASAQELGQWCWAATLSMIFAWHGRQVSQMSIVQQTYGAIVNMPAVPLALINSVNRDYFSDDGEEFSVSSEVWSVMFGQAGVNNQSMIDELRSGNPLVYCNTHHMMALIGVGFWEAPWGPNVWQALVADPWPSSGPFRQLSASEMTAYPMGEMSFVATVHIS